MIRTFNNRELCHVWAQQFQENGKGSHMFFEGPTIYSYGYHFKIAEFIKAPNGQTVILRNPDGYSVTTSKHKSYVWRAITHLTSFECTTNSYSNWDYDSELKNRVESITSTIEKAAKARKDSEWILSLVVAQIKDTRAFCEVFELVDPTTHWDVDALLSTEKISDIKNRQQQATRAKKAKKQNDIKDWLNGERNSLSGVDEIYLRLSNDTVETSLGAHVSIKEARLLYNSIQAGKPVQSFKIGYYTVKDFDGKVLTIGCHKLKLTEINRFASVMQWNAQTN